MSKRKKVFDVIVSFLNKHRSNAVRTIFLSPLLLLTSISCFEDNHQSQRSKSIKIANHVLIDSLLETCKTMFKDVQKDTSRKDLIVLAQKLMTKAEALVVHEQYQLDSLGIAVENEAYALLMTKDTMRAVMRMEFAKQLYRKTGNLKGLNNAQYQSHLFYNTGPSRTTKLAVLDTASWLALNSMDTMQYVMVKEKMAFIYNTPDQQIAFREALLDLLSFKKKYFPINIPQTTYYLANSYEAEGESSVSFKYRLETVSYLSTDSSRKIDHSRYYNMLGYCYFDLGKYDAAKQCFEKALELIVTVEATKNRQASADAISWILACYVAKRQFAEGIAYAKKAIFQYPPSSDRSKTVFAQNLLDLYLNAEEYSAAGKHVAELLRYDLAGTIPEIYKQYTYELIGRYYLGRRDLTNAKIYLIKALDIARKNNDLSSLIEDSRQLFQVDSLAGRYKDAITRYQDYKYYLDQKRLKRQNKEIRELDIKYETEKKEAAVKSLTEKTNLQLSLIKQASFVKNISIVAAILLLLVLIILYNRYRLKQLVNSKLEENQQKINQQNIKLEKLIADEHKLLIEKTKLLEEKDWLLKEVHHRVKNNLQIMMCLLESQSMYAENDALRALEDSQRRLYAMSLIHQKLYQSEDIHTLNMEHYLREFIYYLKESLDVSNRVLFTFNVVPVVLSATQAIPIALITNEAVTNSIKYAFPNNRRGEVSILLKETGDEIELQLADNGVGLPPDVWQGKRNSLGMELIRGLCTEIKGILTFQSEGGTRIIIRFRRSLYNETIHTQLDLDQNETNQRAN